MHTLLVLNLGSTSTKFAVYRDDDPILQETIRHTDAELAPYPNALDQVALRKAAVTARLKAAEFDEKRITCIISRGGKLPPCEAGAIAIDQAMCDYIRFQSGSRHASSACCLLAFELSRELSVPAYCYDPVSVNEMQPIARISGVPELPHFALGHALNTRAVAIRIARQVMHKPFEDCVFIVAHIGGGSSIRLFKGGKNIDAVNDDMGGFSPERSGGLDAWPLVELCYSGKYTKEEMVRKIKKTGGIKAHLGTSDTVKIEARALAGDERCKLVYDAMIYSLAKDIGQMAVPVRGVVDRIILTGGLACSKYVTGALTEYVSFIAPVEVVPGELELEALAEGGLRVLRGQETARKFLSDGSYGSPQGEEVVV